MSESTKIGNAGEHLIMAELLARGLHAFRADRANPAFDISVFKDGVHSLLRVKTTSVRNVQWTAKSNGRIFLELQESNDFVALVDIRNGIRGAKIYIIPTHVVDFELRRCHDHWHSHKKRDGTERAKTNLRGLGLDGNETEGNIALGYSVKWAQYRDAWHLLGMQ